VFQREIQHFRGAGNRGFARLGNRPDIRMCGRPGRTKVDNGLQVVLQLDDGEQELSKISECKAAVMNVFQPTRTDRT